MRYEVWLENGWIPWLALCTDDEQKAREFFHSATPKYKWLYVFDYAGRLLSLNGVQFQT